VTAIYKVHGIKATSRGGRRALAEKLGVAFVTEYDEILRRVKELRKRGLMWKEVAREMGVSETRMDSYRQGVRRWERERPIIAKRTEIAAVED
jgi:hypothetical protein